MNTTRTYDGTRRAAASAENRARVLDVVLELAGTRRMADIALADVAEAAGLSLKTVLRQFGSRAVLFSEAAAMARERVREERRVTPGDVREAIRVLVDHYELRGRAVLLLLAQEDDDPLVAAITQAGKDMHREWVREAFTPHDDRTLDLLVVATDIYAWKLLRLDRRRSRAWTEAQMLRLVTAVLSIEES